MRIQVYPQFNEVDPEEQRIVRQFLIKSFKNETASWTDSIHCVIFIDGKSMRIQKGSYYQIYNKDIYVSHSSNDPSPPHWVPSVLLAIMFFFKLDSDQELKTLAIDLLAKVIADAIRPYQSLLVESFNGAELTEMAIDTETKVILAKHPPLEEGGPERWVAPNGEEMSFRPTHYSFLIPERS